MTISLRNTLSGVSTTKTIPVEIAALQGCYPNFAKAYAIDECMAAQQPSTASVSTAA